jgi:hypothetical protein
VVLAWHSQRLQQLPNGTQAGIAFGPFNFTIITIETRLQIK